jgi:hypothetical protein
MTARCGGGCVVGGAYPVRQLPSFARPFLVQPGWASHFNDLERFPKRLILGFPHRGESDSSFLLEEASMDGEAVFGGLANARGRDD